MTKQFSPLIPRRPAAKKVETLELKERALPRPDLRKKRLVMGNTWSTINPPNLPAPDTESVMLHTWEELDKVLADCKANKLMAFDLETTGLDFYAHQVVSAQITCKEGIGYYVPMFHRGYDKNFDKVGVLERMYELIRDPDVEIVGHNLKFDYKWFHKNGMTEANNFFDTMIAAHVLNENLASYTLKKLTYNILRRDMTTFQALRIAKDPEKVPDGYYKDFSYIPMDTAMEYACADVDMTLRLRRKFKPLLDDEYSKIFYKVEMPLIPVLARMEYEGVELDVAYMSEIGDYLFSEIDKMLSYLNDSVIAVNPEAFSMVLEQLNVNNYYKKLDKDGVRKKKKGFLEKFNWASTAHLRLLFNFLGVETNRYTPGSRTKKQADKKMSTDKKALLGMARKSEHKGHAIARALLAHRQLSKIHGAFCVSLPHQINTLSGRIHPNFNQHRTVTARLSCSDPNMQQIPKTGICAVRYPFKPKDGYVFIQCDYSQVELRIMAHIAEDTAMIEAFKSGIDIHSLTAYECFKGKGIPEGTRIEDIKELYPKLRNAAKTISFGIIYGMGAKSLAETLDISLGKAQEYINAFLSAKPAVQAFIKAQGGFMARWGYVETPLGRRRHMTTDASGNMPFGWERKAVNFPIQSGSAEVLKVVMAVLQAKLDKLGNDARIILQIHDELILECREDQAEAVLALVKDVFEAAVEHLGVTYTVPLIAEPTVQVRWAIEADKCPTCDRWGLTEDGLFTEPDVDGKQHKSKSCVWCNDVRYPGLWDLEATVKTIEDKAITNPDD